MAISHLTNNLVELGKVKKLKEERAQGRASKAAASAITTSVFDDSESAFRTTFKSSQPSKS